MEVDSGVAREPPLDVAVLVDTEMVEDYVRLELLRNRAVERVEKETELPIPMTEVELRHHGSVQCVEDREEVGVPVPSIIVRPRLGEARSEGKGRRGSVEGLDRGLLIDQEDPGVLGRAQAETDDVVDLLDVVLVAADLERADPMRLEPMESPDSANDRGAHPGGPSERAGRPEGRSPRSFVEGCVENPVDGSGRDRRKAARSGASDSTPRSP